MHIKHNTIAALSLVASGAIGGPASAIEIFASNYQMVNGGGQASGGDYNYWDAGYTGTGSTTVDGAFLSGGLGKLTDGVIATQRWDAVSNNAGTGEYVGWYAASQPNPLITFNFAGSPTIEQIDLHLDNSESGGVAAPAFIEIDGVSQSFSLPTGDSITLTFSGLSLTGNSHTIQFFQGINQWTFLSEISFRNSAPVPEPGALGMALSGAVIVAGLARRRLHHDVRRT